MKRLFHLATAIALLASRNSPAEEKPIFGEFPPPSPLTGKVDYSKTVPTIAVPVPAKSNSTPAKITAPLPAPAKLAPAALAVSTPKPVAEKIEPSKPLLVAPGGGLNGKVLMVDGRGRFVVLNFPLGQMPAVNSALDVYRNGVKVGSIKVTGPQRDDSIVADIVSGDLQAGDAARNR